MKGTASSATTTLMVGELKKEWSLFPPAAFREKNPSEARIDATCSPSHMTFLIFPVDFDLIISTSPLKRASPAPFPN